MNPCNESFTEINFQPPNQRPLWKRRGEKKCYSNIRKRLSPLCIFEQLLNTCTMIIKDKLKTEFTTDIMAQGFWYKVKRYLMRLPIVSSVPHLSCHDLTILKIILVISDYVIQILVHFQTSNIISCNTSPWFNAVRSTCAVGNSIIPEQISWVAGWLHVILTMLSLNHNFMKFSCTNNKFLRCLTFL